MHHPDCVNLPLARLLVGSYGGGGGAGPGWRLTKSLSTSSVATLALQRRRQQQAAGAVVSDSRSLPVTPLMLVLVRNTDPHLPRSCGGSSAAPLPPLLPGDGRAPAWPLPALPLPPPAAAGSECPTTALNGRLLLPVPGAGCLLRCAMHQQGGQVLLPRAWRLPCIDAAAVTSAGMHAG